MTPESVPVIVHAVTIHLTSAEWKWLGERAGGTGDREQMIHALLSVAMAGAVYGARKQKKPPECPHTNQPLSP